MILRRPWGWLALALLACNAAPDAAVCSAGVAIACRCADGAPGAAYCRGDGTGYLACACEPGSGGAAASASSVGGAGGAVTSASSSSSTGGAATSTVAASSTGAGGATTTGGGGSTSASGGAGQGGGASSSSGCISVSSSSGAGGNTTHANEWAATILSTGQATVAGVAVDAGDNSVIAGSFTGALDFGCGPVQAAGDDVYVAKYTSGGALLWAKTFASPSGNAFAVAVDPSGDILVGGDFSGTLDFGSGTPMFAQRVFAFLAKLDPSGGYVWQEYWGVIDTDDPQTNAHVRAIAADPLGNLAISGDFSGPLYFPPAGGINDSNGHDYFLTSLDPAGTPVWVQFPGVATGPTALAVDALGDVVVAAGSNGPLFLPGTNQCQTSSCVSLAKLGPDGSLLFSEAFGLSLSPDVRAVAVDASDAIAITGSMPSGTAIDFGGGFVTAPRYPATYLARFDAGGFFVASSGYGTTNITPGGPSSTTPNALACEASGACELAGAFQGSFLDFGCGAIDGIVVETSPYLARLDGSDACLASETLANSTGSANVGAVGLASNGDTIAAGNYGGSVDLGSGTLPPPPAGGTGVFLFRRAP